MNKVATFILLLTISSCHRSNEEKITIAVAANMQYAMKEIIEKFETRYPIKVQTSSSSSGILTTQIRQGAPFDIFISANMRYPTTLYEEGLATSPPKVYAFGSLILWTMEDTLKLNKGLKNLLQNDIRKIAIANSETAPYGIATLEAIRNASLYDSLKTKFVVGESISQVNQYVQLKAADVGITSKSVLYSPNVTQKGQSAAIDKALYTPINQGIVMLKHGKEKNPANTKLFYEFMFSNQVQEILFTFGYEVN